MRSHDKCPSGISSLKLIPVDQRNSDLPVQAPAHRLSAFQGDHQEHSEGRGPQNLTTKETAEHIELYRQVE
jgi:hypothetical protein